MKIESFEEKVKNQQFLNKCKLVVGICVFVIGYLIFQY